ncbi:MAG TPA: YciI family protein [Candidatus Eisenbacteria bacterium]|nr:YciI family protein [Candidatus Eisenbacteria bacterium]
MKFLLMLISDELAWQSLPAAQQEAVVARHGTFERDLTAQGKFLGCNALGPSRDAKTVRLHSDGAHVVTDGPYAEAKELIGGYYLIECASMDEAVAWAKRVPNPFGSVEVRAVWEPAS